MENSVQVVSFQVVPGPEGIAAAEQWLRSAGIEQIRPSPDGGRLHVVAPRELIEQVLGFALKERRRRGRVGAAALDVVDLELPEGATLPASLGDTVAEIIFPVSPEYYH